MTMKKSISEPQVEYQRTKRKVIPVSGAESKFKLSSLRGKLTKQPDTEIEKHILTLRQEWERDI
jgi:hypothetical protein